MGAYAMGRGRRPGKVNRAPDLHGLTDLGSAVADGTPELRARVAPGHGLRPGGSALAGAARGLCVGVFELVSGHPFWVVLGVGALAFLPGWVAGPVFYLVAGLALAGWRASRPRGGASGRRSELDSRAAYARAVAKSCGHPACGDDFTHADTDPQQLSRLDRWDGVGRTVDGSAVPGGGDPLAGVAGVVRGGSHRGQLGA